MTSRTSDLLIDGIHGAAPASVDLDRVGKSFGTASTAISVLHDINLRVAPGETVAILGPSGCGKSTLLRLVAGLDFATDGAVSVDGIRVHGLNTRCSVVFQEPRLLPWKTIGANVRLGTRRTGVSNDVQAWLDLVGLTGFADYLPKQVSGGMAQRAALARALISQPGVLLLDEPFASLDALTRMHMQDLLVEVTETLGTTVLLVTHDVDEALYLSDRIVVLGQRGEEVSDTIHVDLGHPRDRSDERLAPLRVSLLQRFGIHA